MFVHENFFDLFLLFEFTLRLLDSGKRFFPILGTFLFTTRHLNDSFESLNAVSHSTMQLCLHRVEVIVEVLTEANKEGKRLLQVFVAKMDIGSQLCSEVKLGRGDLLKEMMPLV